MWYPKVAPGNAREKKEHIGTVGDFVAALWKKLFCRYGVGLFLTINSSVLEKGLLWESERNKK